ncbi:MAG: hypothetical protein K2H38_07620 [Muribaculaceae bacterium]|nr:hypothetical protein [Muribaculaceae bacterium]MDE6551451.1 hypothetical protein [Muribaculaceae bacterium]
MFDFIYCGFWSVLGGLLVSLVIAGGLLAYSTQYTKRGRVEPLPLVFCGILFCLLFFQMTLMFGAFKSKSFAMDFITACNFQFGDAIDGRELKSQMSILIRENPLVSFFIDYSDLEDFDWSRPIQSLRSVIGREYNWYIFRRIVWSVVFLAIAFVGVMMTSGGSRRSRRRRRSYSFDDDFDFD